MEDGENMIQEFVNDSYVYKLASPVLVISKVKINGVDISKFLSNESKIGWYDVSKNSGRDVTNADGTMILNVINDKYRLDLVTRPLLQDEVVEFFQEIIKKPTMTVDFYNPFNGLWEIIECYRGDRSAQSMLPYNTPIGPVELYNSISQALIEL